MNKKVDCIINVCGKSHQTALTLLSLLRYSGDHIDRIFFIEENKKIGSHEFIRNKLSAKIDYFMPEHWLWINPVDESRLADDAYRLSIRYQYGWEKSDKDFVFITHNDCVYKGDVVGALLDSIGGNIAIGSIGQCWNCPARWAHKCDPSRYWNYRPSLDELRVLYNTVEPPDASMKKRPYHLPDFHKNFHENPWPLPECRVNEWCALVDLSTARKFTVPFGKAKPFGAITDGGSAILDINAAWFRDISNMGYRCRDFPIYTYVTHGSGHQAMLDKDIYMTKENEAYKILQSEFKEELSPD